MTIQEAAEKRFQVNETDREIMVSSYIEDVTHYESLMRAAGYEWVKVDVQTDADIQKMIPEFGSTRFHLTTADIHKALAIGREQGKQQGIDEIIDKVRFIHKDSYNELLNQETDKP